MAEVLTRLPRQLGVLLTVLCLASAGVLPAWGEAFRIENEIFEEDEETPAIHSTTIFYEDLVYDFLESPQEITVFDPAAGRIVLLDLVQKTRTELSVRDLDQLSEQLRTWAARQSDGFLRFSASPEFEEDYDSSTGGLQLSSPWLTYQVETAEPPRKEILDLYLDFCDRYCLLNARLNPGSRPPFPRIQLNRALERVGRMPEDVHLTVRPKGQRLLGEKKMSARSHHRVIPHLLESDRSRIAQTDQFMAIFRPLTFQEYQALVQPRQ